MMDRMNERATLLKPGEAAGVLGLSRVTIYRLIASGELASVTVGPGEHLRVTRESVERFAAAEADHRAREAEADLLRPDEVAAELRISRITAYRLIAAGTLPSVTVGRAGHRRVRRADLDAYLNPDLVLEDAPA
jgi:excisionase family DNA binding protein